MDKKFRVAGLLYSKSKTREVGVFLHFLDLKT